MHDTFLEPSLESLFDQYEDISGAETFGPNGTAILLAVWRKSRKLGWAASFSMTNTEIHYQTGIKSRETISTYRDKLVEAGIMDYKSPPRGQSKGEYILNFNFTDKKAVQNMDNSTDNKGEVVQEMDYFTPENGKAVQNMDNFTDTVLKDLKDTITTNNAGPDAFEILLSEYCILHGKLDINVKRNDVVLMQWMLDQQIPVELMIKVMRELHKERTAIGTVISTFVYYKQAILEAWEAVKAITDRVPVPAVALGEDSITGRVPIPMVALGSSPKRTKQQQELDDLRRRAEEERQREQIASI